MVCANSPAALASSIRPVLPQHSPPCHEIREPHPRVHVADRPEPIPHAGQGGGGAKTEHKPRVSKATFVFCASCLRFTGPRDLLESGCLEAGTDDSEEQREERF